MIETRNEHAIPVRPSPFADDDEYDMPEASGAHVSCGCSQCREMRLVDDERIAFDAYDMAWAFGAGWMAGRRTR